MIGLRKSNGMFYLDFFAMQQTIEMTQEDAADFASQINAVLAAPEEPVAPIAGEAAQPS